MNLSSRLNCRVDVYGKTEVENELGEVDYSYGKIKSIWAEITPGNGAIKNSKNNTIYADISHKFVIRTNAIPNLSNDMYFMYKGQRYDIKYFNPNYKYRNSIEVLCSLVVE
ncbi:MAG: head-tail adaptor protein [Clostridium thermopalmarium]|uniref:phage head closure protein n=1 Tax=Clostridium thermopalmarium TaxID=29373 RepID=UPI002352DAAA|nr:phage head closure protein [Clostridium thermopalmarium]MBE6043545.1 head-tail adaptor protein [Clostridium thermopalmarium]